MPKEAIPEEQETIAEPEQKIVSIIEPLPTLQSAPVTAVSDDDIEDLINAKEPETSAPNVGSSNPVWDRTLEEQNAGREALRRQR